MPLNEQEQSDEASCKREPEDDVATEYIAKIRKTSLSYSETLSQQSNNAISTRRNCLENECDHLAEAEKTVEELKRMVKRTETELEDAINNGKGAPVVVCGSSDILRSALFPFLEPVDLGRAGQVTRLWRVCCCDECFWKALSLKRWPFTPINVVPTFGRTIEAK